MRLLSVIEVDEIEAALMGAVHKLIKNKKFSRYLVDNHYTIAIDGTQKFKRDVIWAEECLEREVKDGNSTRRQYYVNVLEANLVPEFCTNLSKFRARNFLHAEIQVHYQLVARY